MRFRRLAWALMLFFGFFSFTALGADADMAQLARKGKIDFLGQLQIDGKAVAVNGEWEFYWKQLLTPEDFKHQEIPQLSGYITLPGFWNDFVLDGKKIGGKGFATFRLVADNVIPHRNILLNLPNINSAYRLYINGVFVDRCGTVGVAESQSIPEICPLAPGFYLDQERIELIIQVSNFRHALGGIRNEISFSDYRVFERDSNWKLAFDLFLIGALMIMGFYYIGVFTLRMQERSTLYFGLFCLVMTLRTSFLNSTFFIMLFPGFNWVLYQTLDFLTLSVSPALFSTFLYYLYPQEFSKLIHRGVYVASLLLVGVTLAVSSYTFTGLMTVYQLFILFVCSYVIYTLALASIHKRKGSREMLAGSVILIASIVNDILYSRSLIDTSFIAGYGLLVFFFSQSFVITKRFTDALKDFEELSMDLDIKIKDQTSEISDLLDNTGQGILSFDRSMTIQQHASRATFFIFEKSVFGENILNLMFPENKDETAGYLDIIFHSRGNIRLVKDLLPTEYFRNNRYYDLSFSWIPAGKKKPDRVMVILTDVTVKRKLEKMLEKDELRNQKIIRIAVDRHGFLRFYNSIQNLLSDIKTSLNFATEYVDAYKISSQFHTIKGGLAGYSFNEVAAIAHQAESLLENVNRNEDVLSEYQVSILLDYTERLGNIFKEKIFELGDLVPRQFLEVANMGFYRISEDKIIRLEQFIKENLSNHAELEHMVNNLRKQPLRNLVKKIASDAKDVAFQLGKQIEVNYTGEENQIIHTELDEFFSTLIHLVRNAVDHGIEPPAQRLQLGKPEIGRLSINIQLKNQCFLMVFADDGRGLDVEALKQRAEEKGIITLEKINNLNDDEARLLIFEPGFSTTKNLTSFSGRGLGMNAVATAVRELGGTIKVSSQLGNGTTFTISIPVKF